MFAAKTTRASNTNPTRAARTGAETARGRAVADAGPAAVHAPASRVSRPEWSVADVSFASRGKESSTARSGFPAGVTAALQSPGEPLGSGLGRQMGRQFGRDFSHVRVHTGDTAARSARELKAAAYAVGPRIVFAQGAYAPSTQRGQQLIAHELVHVVQQESHGRPSGRLISRPTDAAERQADAAVHRMSRGLTVGRISPEAPSAQLSLAPEMWYRGFVPGGPTAADALTSGERGWVHDLGGGVYFTDSAEVAKDYADMRASDLNATGGSAVGVVAGGNFDPAILGTSIDLTKEPKFMEPYNHLVSVGMKPAGEMYRNLVDNFLKSKGTKVDDYATIIGPEGIRGGRQMRIRDVNVGNRVVQNMLSAKAGGGPKGGSGNTGGSGESADAHPAMPNKAVKAPAPPPAQEAPKTPRQAVKGAPAAPVQEAPKTPRQVVTRPNAPPVEETPEAPKTQRRTAPRGEGFEGGGIGLGKSIAISVGVMAFTAARTYLFGKAMDDALANTPSFADKDMASTAKILGTMKDDSNTSMMSLFSSDIQSYANNGFFSAHSPVGWSFTKRAIDIDGIKDDAARMDALNHLRIDVVNDVQELGHALENVNKLLQLEPEIKARIEAAKSLKAIIENPIVAEHLITDTGLSVEAWSAITSNLANYIAVHQIVLDSLHSLQAQITKTSDASDATLKMLNNAAEHNAHLVP